MQIIKEAVMVLMGRTLPDAERINIDMDQLKYLF
jgi:hypothetical protein